MLSPGRGTGGTWVYEVVYAALVVGASLLVLSPVLRRSGWPLNQGSTAPLLLVQMYAAHLRHFDLVPVWSSTDGIGLGTPVLLYYHRAFFYVAGLIDVLVGGHLKFSVETTLAIFLAVGAYGMRQALRVVSDSRLLCTVGSLGFLFTNYAFTDWLDPRGDLAEFSAMMLVPWLLYWCLTLVRDRRVSLVLIPTMVLLVNAHSAVALYSVVTLVVALATFIGVAGLSGLRAVARRLIVVVGVTTLVLAPLLVAELKVGEFYDPQTKNSELTPVARQFVPLGSYFNGIGHHWFAPMGRLVYFVQIDFAVWVPIAMAAAGTVLYWVQSRRGGGRWHLPQDVRGAPMVFLAVSLVAFLVLQWRASLFVYRIIAPLEVTNFPWRMLVFITPLGVVLVVALADRLMRRLPSPLLWGALSALWLGVLIVLSPLTSTVAINYGLLALPGGFPPVKVFAAPNYVDYQTFDGFFLGSSVGELYTPFLPKVQQPNGRELPNDDRIYRELHAHQSGAQSIGPVGCTVVAPEHAPFETLQLSFMVSCAGATRLALPVSYNASSSLFVERHGVLHPIPYFHVRTDPRIVIAVGGAGPETVVVHLPTLWGILW